TSAAANGGGSSATPGPHPEARRSLPLHIARSALRRFRPAISGSVFTSENLHLQSAKIRGKIVKQRGPYLFSGNWWDEKSWVRAEWDLQVETGELVLSHESQRSE